MRQSAILVPLVSLALAGCLGGVPPEVLKAATENRSACFRVEYLPMGAGGKLTWCHTNNPSSYVTVVDDSMTIVHGAPTFPPPPLK